MISEKNQKQLLKFIQGLPESQETLSYQNITGFLYGIGISPASDNPYDWLDFVLGEGSVFEKNETKKLLTDCLIHAYNDVVEAFRLDALAFPFDLEKMFANNEELEPFIDWIAGFVNALYIRADFWDGPRFAQLDQEKRQLLIHCMLMLEGIVEPEIVKDAFEKLPMHILSRTYPTLDLQGDRALQQILMICVMASKDAVETLQDYAKNYGKL